MSSSYFSNIVAFVGGALAAIACFHYCLPKPINDTTTIKEIPLVSAPNVSSLLKAATYSPCKAPGLCKSLDHALCVMRGIVKFSSLQPDIQIALENLFTTIQMFNFANLTNQTNNGKFLSIEGLASSGKSKLVLNLQNSIKNVSVFDENYELPECFSKLKQYIDEDLELEDCDTAMVGKRVLKLIKLYYLAYVIRSQVNSDTFHVSIVTNYYHELCADILNNELSRSACSTISGSTPPQSNEFYEYFTNCNVFEWPFDLPKPDLV